MSLTLCVSRGYALATDDRKARRIAASVGGPSPLLATSELLSTGFDRRRQSRQNPGMIGGVELRARFQPWPKFTLAGMVGPAC